MLQQAGGVLTGPGLTLMRLTGPGRVGIQSMYMEHRVGVMTDAGVTYVFLPVLPDRRRRGRDPPARTAARRSTWLAGTTSGWTELPAIPDMTRIQMGQSSAQIMGKLAPAADMRLAAGEGVFFPNDNLLWQEPAVEVSAMSLRGGWDRMRAGLPVVMLQAAGSGDHLASLTTPPARCWRLPVQAGGRDRRPGASPGGGHPRRRLRLVRHRHLVQHQRRPGAPHRSGGAGLLKMGLDLAGHR